MNYLDIIIAIPLIIGIINGFRKGLIKSIASLLALLVGIWGAIYCSKFISELLINHFHFSSKHLPIIAFIITFILFVIGVHLLATFIHKLIHAIALGFINRLLGAAFGLIRNAIIISVILLIVNYFNQITQTIPVQVINSSVLYPPVSSLVPSIFPHLNFESSEWQQWLNKLKP